MTRWPGFLCGVFIAGASGLAGAQATPQTARANATAAADATAPTDGRAEPQVVEVRTEDDAVRIEALRVRGLTQHITVTPKIDGVPSYQIIPPDAGRPPDRDPRAGLRVWVLPLPF